MERPPSQHEGATTDARSDSDERATVVVAPGVVEPGVRGQDLAIGEIVGRYVVVREVGRGGMGAVYAAYDEELDRRVAIKIVGRGSDSDSSGPERLRREAQVMARLSHPNVAQVYDVGVHRDHVLFIAMEFCRGVTLRAWMAERRRGWSEVLEVMIAAGRGLSAAHEAGVIHRDFKPGNVMVGEGDPVRVLDFGIARAERGADSEIDDDMPLRGPTSEDITAAGTVVGTPAFMAPEQRRGQADARSDQYSFSLTLWCALTQQRPPPRHDEAGFDRHLRSAAVPAWLRRAVLRGLERDPSARAATMAELLQLLDPARSSGRRRTLALVLGGLALSLSGYAMAVRGGGNTLGCADAATELDAVWNESRRTELERGLAGIGVGFAASTAERAGQEIEAYAARWKRSRVGACEARWVHAENSAQLYDARVGCLRRAQKAIDALATDLETPDLDGLRRAVKAARALPRLDRCDDPDRLAREPQAPDDLATVAAIAEVEAGLAGAYSAITLGRYALSYERAVDMEAKARALGHAPLVLSARLQLARSQLWLGRYEECHAGLQELYWDALAQGHDDLAAEAANLLLFVVGERLSRPADALPWSRNAQALIVRTGSDPVREAERLQNLGTVEVNLGRSEEGLAHLYQALELTRELQGDDGEWVGDMHGVLGHAYYTRGAYVEARKHYDLQFAMLTATRTPDHPDLAAALGNIGMLSTVAGDSEGAEETLRRSLALYESGYGPGHVETSQALYNLAVLLEMRKKYDEALRLAERALVILRAELGPEHPRALSQTAVQGRILSALGRKDEARRVLVDAVATIDRTLGPEHDALLYPLGVLMELEQSEGNDEAALAAATRAHKVALRAGRIDLAATFSESVGRALVRLGRTRPAGEAFDEAVRLHEQTQGNPRALAVVLRRRAALRTTDDADGAAQDLARALALLERDEMPEVTRLVPVLVAQAQLFAQAGQTADAEAAVIRAEGLVLREPEDSVARAIAKFGRAQRDFPTRPQDALASAREVRAVLEASARDEAVEVLPTVRAFLTQSESSAGPAPRP